MKNFLFRILLFVLALPLFFACSTSRDFTAFSSNTGGYHGKTEGRKPASEAAQITAATETEMLVSQPSETAVATTENAEPVTELNTIASRVQQAAAEAKIEANTANRTVGNKLSFGEKLVLKKALKMAEKAASGKELKSNNPTEIAKPALDQNLKLAIIFLVLALIASLIWGLLAAILLIISLVFFLLWALTL